MAKRSRGICPAAGVDMSAGPTKSEPKVCCTHCGATTRKHLLGCPKYRARYTTEPMSEVQRADRAFQRGRRAALGFLNRRKSEQMSPNPYLHGTEARRSFDAAVAWT